VKYKVEISKHHNTVQLGFIERTSQKEQLLQLSALQSKQILKNQMGVQIWSMGELSFLLDLVDVKFGRLYLKQEAGTQIIEVTHLAN